MGSTAMVKRDDQGAITFAARGFSQLGYAPSALTLASWTDDAEFVQRLDRANKWIQGDFFVAGDYFGEDAAQVLGDEMAWGFGPEKMTKLAYVARNVRPPQRRADLSWSHHMLVAPLPPAEQEEWLSHAHMAELSVRELRAHMIEAGAITPKPKGNGLLASVDDLVVPYVEDDEEPAATVTDAGTAEAAPEYPMLPLTAADLPSEPRVQRERAPAWDTDDYEREEDDIEVPADNPRKAARILLNLGGAEYCAKLIQELSELMRREEYITVDAE